MWLSLKHEQDQIDRLHIYKELKNLGQKEQGLNEFQTKLICHQFFENAVVNSLLGSFKFKEKGKLIIQEFRLS